MRLNDQILISFHFSHDDEIAQYYIISEVEVKIILDSDLVDLLEFSKVTQKLYRALSEQVCIEDFSIADKEISFFGFTDTPGFSRLEEFEPTANAAFMSIVSCIDTFSYPYEVTLTVDGVY